MKTIYKYEKSKNNRRRLLINLILSLIIGAVIGTIRKNIFESFIWFTGAIMIFISYTVAKIKFEEYNRIKKMEEAFPDFLQLMASNLRAGMPTDHALLMSARKEFDPLDKEIVNLGKEFMTGKDIESAMYEMGQRTNSKKIQRTINLILSGLKSGGNIAILLEETATNARERYFIQKRAASNVLMYTIFIFVAITVGAPGLFGLSTVLVEVLTGVLSGIPDVQMSSSLPFTLSKIDLPISVIIYFSVIFLLAIDIIGSMVLGLVSKGSEKEGIKYAIPLTALSMTVFFSVRVILMKYFADFFDI